MILDCKLVNVKDVCFKVYVKINTPLFLDYYFDA